MGLSLVGYGAPDGSGDVVDEPIDEPLTLTEAKRQTRRQFVEDDDAYLQDTLIPAVRERAEQATGRQFITATWDLTLDHWPCGEGWPGPEGTWFGRSTYGIRLPRPPLQQVSWIKYVDTAGVLQTLATSQYQVVAPAGPRCGRGRIVPAWGVWWPSVRCQPDAITVRFVAGYGDEHTDVPPRLKLAMLLDLGTLFENREDQVVGQGYAVSPFQNGSDAVYRAFKSY